MTLIANGISKRPIEEQMVEEEDERVLKVWTKFHELRERGCSDMQFKKCSSAVFGYHQLQEITVTLIDFPDIHLKIGIIKMKKL